MTSPENNHDKFLDTSDINIDRVYMCNDIIEIWHKQYGFIQSPARYKPATCNECTTD